MNFQEKDFYRKKSWLAKCWYNASDDKLGPAGLLPVQPAPGEACTFCRSPIPATRIEILNTASVNFQIYSSKLKKSVSSFKNGRLSDPSLKMLHSSCILRSSSAPEIEALPQWKKVIPYTRSVGWDFGGSIWTTFLCILLFVLIKKNFTSWLVTE